MRTAFAVLHSETSEQVAVDMDYHRAMFELSQRVNPKESIVGWCVVFNGVPLLAGSLARSWLSGGSGIQQGQI